MNAVDTNVLIYACDSRDPVKRARARDLMRELPDPVLLWQVACEFIAASRKLAPQGFTQEAAWSQLTALLAAWPLAVAEAPVLDVARSLHLQRGVSFWDAMLYAACLQAGVTRLYTQDVRGSVIDGLEIIKPFA